MEQMNQRESVNKVAEIELIYKSTVKASERPKISSAKDAYDLFIRYWDKNRLEFVEEFKVMLLSRSNKVLGICSLTTGGVAGTIADPKLVFITALKANASYVMIAHNHPSGNLKASKADGDLTAKISEAGKFLDLPLLDHLIISEEGYYSFAEEGLI